jgi:hypothetical protein
VTRVVTLIGCGKAKRETAQPARHLYIGNLFRAALEHAEATSHVVFIVSGRHGLLELDQVVEPYEYELRAVDGGRWARDVVHALDLRAPRTPATRVVVFAGGAYARALGEVLPAAAQPCAGMTIGRRLRWFARARLERDRAAARAAALEKLTPEQARDAEQVELMLRGVDL